VRNAEDWVYSSSRCYLKAEEDALVDPHTFEGEQIEIKGEAEKRFTYGQVISSDLFKIHFEEEPLSHVPS
jgi:hypothetical protein